MIFFYTATGDLIKQVPEKVYQGSNKANRIWFVCPTGATNVVNVAFKLPDGHYTPKIAMYSEVVVGDLIGNVVGGAMANETSAGIAEVLDKENTPYSVWYYEIPQSVTAFVGKVKVQFSIYNTDETLYSQVTSFDVLPGFPPIQQEEFDSQYDRVMQEIVAINETIQNLGDGGISQEQLDEIARQLATKQDKVDGVDISGTNAEGVNVSITPHGVLARVHFEDIDEEHTAAITPTGLTIGCRRDGNNKYWVLSCEYEDIPEGYSEIVNTPPRTDGALATLTDVTNEIAKIVGGADTSYDTLKEIADWIKAHPEDVASINSKIQANSNKITALETTVGNIETALDSIIAIQNSILGGNA